MNEERLVDILVVTALLIGFALGFVVRGCWTAPLTDLHGGLILVSLRP